MKCAVRRLLRRLVPVAPVLLLLVCSCDDSPQHPPNQWRIVHSSTEPGPLTEQGIVWLPRQIEPGVWCYRPLQVCAFIDNFRAGNCGTIDQATLVINGQKWTVTANGENAWKICSPWEQTENDQSNFGEHVMLVLIIIAGIIAAAIAYNAGIQAGAEQARQEASESISDTLQDREKAAARRERDLQSAQEKNARWRDSEEQALEKARTDLMAREREMEEQRKRELVSLRDAEAMLRTPTEPSGPTAIAKYLRKQHVQGAVLGDLITATFLADPSGFIRLAWKVQVDRPVLPTVRVTRDGKVIRTDVSLAGEHGDHVVPGRRYVYEFQLLDDRSRPIGRGVHFEVKIPAAEAWNFRLDVDEDERQKNLRTRFMSKFNGFKTIEELKQECYAEVKSKQYPADLEEWLLAKVEGLAAELSGTSAA